ncbi:MAG: hypothetical protein ACJAYU_000768 [Bradymonadia bacterium]|jgi:hypothetical protein
MANEPHYEQDRLRESANRGVIPEDEMMRRAESVSHAAIIIRNFEAEAKKKRMIGLAISVVVGFGLYFAFC